MFNYKRFLATVFISLITTVQLLAEKKPPAPRGNGGFDDGVVVGGSIDDFLPLLFLVALVFGVWVITKKLNSVIDS